ncbi:MAG TPA: urea ABC transporter permease subunit UrtB [Geminicoccaceae bacterium]
MRHGRLPALATVLAVVLLIAPSSVEAESFEEAVRALALGSYGDKAEAVDALAALGDDRGVPVLQAMADGRLFVREADGAIVVGERQGRDYRLTGALDGADVGTAASRDFDKVKVNNRVRGTIEAALGRLQLQNLDPARRIAAIDAILGDRTAASAEMLREALAAEEDPGVRSALAFGTAAMDLAGDDPDRRLAAIDLLSSSYDRRARGLLGQVAGDDGATPEVRQAAEAAIAAVERRQGMLELGLHLYQGISLGSILLLAAIGLAITFGVMGVINMAHGEMIMLGAYTAFVVQELFRAFLPHVWFDVYLVAAVPVGFLVAAAVGIGIERGVIRFLYGRPLETLLASWGISLILQQSVRMIFGASNRAVANPDWMSGGIELIGGIVLTWNRLVIIVFCLAVLAAVALVLRFTRFGLEMRAVTQNRAVASTMGINTARVDALTFGLGSGVAGMGGVALSQIGNVSPNLGQLYVIDSFMVVVFGGVGNLAGTFVGAMSLGIINKLLEPMAGAVLGKVAVLALIILFIQRRPRGLFALRGRAAEA